MQTLFFGVALPSFSWGVCPQIHEGGRDRPTEASCQFWSGCGWGARAVTQYHTRTLSKCSDNHAATDEGEKQASGLLWWQGTPSGTLALSYISIAWHFTAKTAWRRRLPADSSISEYMQITLKRRLSFTSRDVLSLNFGRSTNYHLSNIKSG